MSETKETSDAVDAPAPTGNERAKEASGLNKVTDFVAERNLDQSRVEAAIRALADSEEKMMKERAERERELAAVKVTDADIALLVQELEVSRADAELRLRENGGDVLATLRAFVTVK